MTTQSEHSARQGGEPAVTCNDNTRVKRTAVTDIAQLSKAQLSKAQLSKACEKA